MFNNCRVGSLTHHHKTDKLGEECGIFGGYCKSGDIAPLIKTGLFKLQHRGQESAGMCVGGSEQAIIKDSGLVNEVFSEDLIPLTPTITSHKTILNRFVRQSPKEQGSMSGNFGIGHVRYSTQGGSNKDCIQPFLVQTFGGQISCAHNGNIKDAAAKFSTNSDSEALLKSVVLNLNKSPQDISFNEIGNCLNKDFSQGAFCVVFYLPNRVLAYRDIFGYRPLMFCEAKEGYFIASEDVAFSFLEIEKIIEIQAGWGVEITEYGYEIKQFASKTEEKKCVFEHIYFANPASNIFDKNVYESRIELGKLLAKGDRLDADIVVPVMNSGLVAAMGYSIETKIPFEIGILINDWSGRSFIKPTQKSRNETVKEKLTAIKSVVQGKRVVLVDDSIVRGTTSVQVIKMLKEAGAKEIHFRLSSPMITNTCFWGVDIPTKEELLAITYKTEEKIAKFIGADSVKYLALNDLKQYFGSGWCYNCLMVSSEISGESNCQQLTKEPVSV